MTTQSFEPDTRHSTARRRATRYGGLLLVCLLCGAALAQSGRRQPPPRTEAPVPTPTPEAPKPTPTPVPQLKLLVTSDQASAISISPSDSSIVTDTVMRRLHSSEALSIQTADRMSRQQARKRARTETERHIVWFALQVDPFASGSASVIRPSAEDLRIEYEVFQPGTDKPLSAGIVYLRSTSNIPIGRRNISCYPTQLTSLDTSLVIGALETAERIFGALSVSSPPLCQ